MNYRLPIILDGQPVEKITAFLFPKGGNENPRTLLVNAGKSFIGSYVLGMGFTFDNSSEQASSIDEMNYLIERNPKNADVIFPFISGEDVCGHPDQKHQRYVINFGEISEDEAWNYPDLMKILEEKVKGHRSSHSTAPWWQHERPRAELYKTISRLDRVLVNPLYGKYLVFAFLPARTVFANKINVMPFENDSAVCILQSRIHEIWAWFFSATLKDDLAYAPSDCFETFPFPANWETDPTLEAIGKAYYEYRAALMIRNNQGLTTTYNRFHDPEETDPNLLKLRELHTAMDKAVLTAYGWPDIDTTCEFILDYEDEADSTSKRKKPYRYRWPQATHDEVLARLLTLNQQRYDQEILMGKGAAKKSTKHKAAGGTKKGGKSQASKSPVPATDTQLALIPEPTQQLDVWSTIEPSET